MVRFAPQTDVTETSCRPLCLGARISQPMAQVMAKKRLKPPVALVFRFYSGAAWRILCALAITRLASIIAESKYAA